MITNGEIISRIKTSIKKINQDNRLVTNKYIFSLATKWRDLHISRLDSRNSLTQIIDIFQTLHNVELIEVDKVLSKCTAIKSNIYIKRTKHKVPSVVSGSLWPLIKDVNSIDGDNPLTGTTRGAYIYKANSPNFKYNKALYYWYEDGYLWFPNIEWDAVQITALFKEDITAYQCAECKEVISCTSRLEEQFRAPSKILPDIEVGIMNDLRVFLSIQVDETINKNSNQ